jgi:hypothetical protein
MDVDVTQEAATSTTRSSFFSVPRELRDQIYGQLLRGSFKTGNAKWWRLDIGRTRHSSSADISASNLPDPHCFRICKQSLRELREVIFREGATLAIGSQHGLYDERPSSNPIRPTFPMITNLHIDVHKVWEIDYPCEVRQRSLRRETELYRKGIPKFAQQMVDLRRVTIQLVVKFLYSGYSPDERLSFCEPQEQILYEICKEYANIPKIDEFTVAVEYLDAEIIERVVWLRWTTSSDELRYHPYVMHLAKPGYFGVPKEATRKNLEN